MGRYVVTGATSGIGNEVVRQLRARGDAVLATGRNAEALDALGALGCTVLPCNLVLDDDRVALAEAIQAFGATTVILNAGVSQRSLARDTSLDVYRGLMEINYFAQVDLVQRLLPWARGHRVHFVYTSSLVGFFGTPWRSGYSASKHGMHGYLESLEAEEARNGLRFSIIAPGFVRTNVSVNALTGDGSKLGTTDRAQTKGLDVAVAAARYIKAMDQGKAVAIVAGKEGLGYPLKRFLPGLFRRLLRRARVR